MALLVVLLLAALVFGVGGLIKGLFWLVLIGVALLALSAFTGFRTMGSRR